jgi:hypothetical protein
MPILVFSDLHLRAESAEVCFRVLDWIRQHVISWPRSQRHVVCCGDFWHLRYKVAVGLLSRVNALLEAWGELGIQLDLVPGNHDQIDTAGTNALEVFAGHEHVRVWTDPGIVIPDDDAPRLAFLPYRRDPREIVAAVEELEADRPKYYFGHFGVAGAAMNGGHVDTEGLAIPKVGGTFVLGHYHRPQHGAGWIYVGSPYQTSFGEAGDANRVLILRGLAPESLPIDVAPKHYVVRWDPRGGTPLPERPGEPGDRVRVDVVAASASIVAGDLSRVLKDAGFDGDQVNVAASAADREVKLQQRPDESLQQAAARFVDERGGDVADLMVVLDRWVR